MARSPVGYTYTIDELQTIQTDLASASALITKLVEILGVRGVETIDLPVQNIQNVRSFALALSKASLGQEVRLRESTRDDDPPRDDTDDGQEVGEAG